jgi:hypothetical protein
MASARHWPDWPPTAPPTESASPPEAGPGAELHLIEIIEKINVSAFLTITNAPWLDEGHVRWHLLIF